MSRIANSVPAYRHQKPSGKAVVTINGRDIYLGGFGTRESRDAYDRTIAEWLAVLTPAIQPGDAVIAEPPDHPPIQSERSSASEPT